MVPFCLDGSLHGEAYTGTSMCGAEGVQLQAVQTAAHSATAGNQLDGILKLAARHSLDSWQLKTQFIVSQLTRAQDLPADHLQGSDFPAHLSQRSSSALSALSQTFPHIPSSNSCSLAAWCQLAVSCAESPAARATLQACGGFCHMCKQHAPRLEASSVVEPLLRAAVGLPASQQHPGAAAEALAASVTPANLEQLQQGLAALDRAAADMQPGFSSGLDLGLPSSQLLAAVVATQLLAGLAEDQNRDSQQLQGVLPSLDADLLEQLACWAVLGGHSPALPGLQEPAPLETSLAAQQARAGVRQLVLRKRRS